MKYTKQLCQIVALLFLNNVTGSVAETVPELPQSCPESCPWSTEQSHSTGATDWCSEVDFPEPPYETKLPDCKNVTLKSDFNIRANNKVVLQKYGYIVFPKDSWLAEDKKTANFCLYLSPQLQNCKLKLLNRRLYAYDESLLALKNCKTKDIISPGDFYVLPDSKEIVSCSESLGYHISLIQRCEYINLTPTEYEFTNNKTTIRLLSSNQNVHGPLYGPYGSLPNITLCFPLNVEMTKCPTYKLKPHEYRLDTDHRVYVLRYGMYLNLGEYRSFSKENTVEYCQTRQTSSQVYLVFYCCYIIQLVSAFFIILAIVIHLLFPSINYHAKPLVCQMSSMAVFYIAGPYRFLWYPETELGCYVVFTFVYFSALTSFFWLNILAFDLWSIFANLQTSSMLLCANMCDKKPKFLLYCVYAYVIPLVMVILSLVLETQIPMQDALGLHPDISGHCWFSGKKSLYLFYSGPIFFLLCVNIALFGLTVCNLRSASEGVAMVNKQRNRQLLFVCIKIFVIMGLCWIIEFITFLADGQGAASYPAIIAMSIQGILLFIIYICKPSTYRTLRRKVAGTISSKRKTPPSLPKGTGYSNSGISMESVLSSENPVKVEPQGTNSEKT